MKYPDCSGLAWLYQDFLAVREAEFKSETPDEVFLAQIDRVLFETRGLARLFLAGVEDARQYIRDYLEPLTAQEQAREKDILAKFIRDSHSNLRERMKGIENTEEWQTLGRAKGCETCERWECKDNQNEVVATVDIIWFLERMLAYGDHMPEWLVQKGQSFLKIIKEKGIK